MEKIQMIINYNIFQKNLEGELLMILFPKEFVTILGLG
jgi:hypothetical protein